MSSGWRFPRPVRILLFLLCTAVSSLGFLWPLYLLSDGWLGAVVALIVAYAWFSYFVMAVAWINDVRVSRWWPASGTVAGFASPCFSAFLATSLTEAIQSFAAQLLLVFPAFLLATLLVAFHWKGGSKQGIEGG